MKKQLLYSILFLIICTVKVFSATYTWNKPGGGQWNTTANWTPASPAGGPPSGSDVIIPALTNNTKVITDVPQITLNSITCTGAGTSWLTAATTGNTITITSTWIVPASHTLTIGAPSERLCWKLLNTSTSTIDGYVAFDAGSTNRNFDVYGTLIVNANGCIFDPNPTGGSDFYFYAGCTLKTQKPQGFSTTAATSVATINYNVAVCTGGSYSYITGINFEYNGTANQVTGLGLNQNTAANVVISNITGTVTLSGNTQISGSLTISANATFSASTYSLSVGATTGAGNFINNGTFNSGTGAVTFNGNAAQTISGSSTSIFNNLILNNANGLTLSTPAQVKGTLGLTTGLLNTTTTNVLTLLNGATAPALTAASTSYINGPMKYQKSTSGSSTLNFPIGKSADCRPIQLVVNHANTNLYNYLGESFNASAKALNYTKPVTIDTVSSVHYWDITRTDNASVSQPTLDLAGSQTVKLHFGNNDAVKDLTTLRVVKNTYSATTTWIDLATGGSTGGTTTTGNITSGNFNSFSRFTLAGSAAGINPLPITLIDFSGTCMDDHVELKWITASEVNNDYFLIERSEDGYNWIMIDQVKGNGSSNSIANYSFNDYSILNDINYYRISQVDFDKTVSMFNTIDVECDNRKTETILFPNPINKGENLTFNLGDKKSKNVHIRITDTNGKVVYDQFYSNPIEKKYIEFKNLNISQGVYIVNLNHESMNKNLKLIIQ